jgi:hypothetical protein
VNQVAPTRTTRTMRSFNSIRFCRALARHRRARAVRATRHPRAATRTGHPTIYADARLSRVLTALESRASDLEMALADYVRDRRGAGMRPEAVVIEFRRLLCRAAGLDVAVPRLTGRLVELYFAA